MSDLERKPSRRRGLWWKLPLLGLVLVFVVALLAHRIWTGKEQAKVAALVNEIRARGEPIELGDLVDAPVPEDQNAAAVIRAAEPLMKRDQELEDRKDQISIEHDDAFAMPLTDVERAVLNQRVAQNAAALQAIAALDKRTSVSWGEVYATPMRFDASVGKSLNATRGLGTLIGDQAKLAIDSGRSADAVVAIRRIGLLANAIGQKPLIVGYLVGLGLSGLATDCAIEAAPSLIVEDAVARANVERLIAELLDDAAIERTVRRGLSGDRVASHDAFQAMAAGKLTTSMTQPAPGGASTILARLLSPLLYRSDAVVLGYDSEMLKNLDAANFAEFKRRAKRLHEIQAKADTDKTEFFAYVAMPSLRTAFLMRYSEVTDRHMAACALAIRLHLLDHDGQRPATLDALVPKYLPRVPTDGIDGAPIRYDPKRAILWGVGENGVDDNGSATVKQPHYARQRRMMADAVVHLDRQPRLPAATQSTEDAASESTTAPSTQASGGPS